MKRKEEWALVALFLAMYVVGYLTGYSQRAVRTEYGRSGIGSGTVDRGALVLPNHPVGPSVPDDCVTYTTDKTPRNPRGISLAPGLQVLNRGCAPSVSGWFYETDPPQVRRDRHLAPSFELQSTLRVPQATGTYKK